MGRRRSSEKRQSAGVPDDGAPRSYFDLLEAKYGDGDATPSVGPPGAHSGAKTPARDAAGAGTQGKRVGAEDGKGAAGAKPRKAGGQGTRRQKARPRGQAKTPAPPRPLLAGRPRGRREGRGWVALVAFLMLGGIAAAVHFTSAPAPIPTGEIGSTAETAPGATQAPASPAPQSPAQPAPEPSSEPEPPTDRVDTPRAPAPPVDERDAGEDAPTESARAPEPTLESTPERTLEPAQTTTPRVADLEPASPDERGTVSDGRDGDDGSIDAGGSEPGPGTAPGVVDAAAPATEPRRAQALPTTEALAPEPANGGRGGDGSPAIAAVPARRADFPGDDASPTQSAPALPLETSDLVPARRVFAPQPGYPAEARDAGEQGTVIVAGTVDAGGSIKDARVLRGRSPSLDRAALAAFRTWQFEPATRGGVAEDFEYRVALHFSLERPRATENTQAASLAAEPATTPPPPPPEDEPPATGDGSEPLPFRGDFEPPVRVASPLPRYPSQAWAAGVEGVIALMLTVDREGAVVGVDVLEGLPYGLTQAAVEAVRQWRFEPARRNGEPVAVRHRVTLRFAP
ncbi:MAG: TonB family protein [Acidobacteriota bacterium]